MFLKVCNYSSASKYLLKINASCYLARTYLSILKTCLRWLTNTVLVPFTDLFGLYFLFLSLVHLTGNKTSERAINRPNHRLSKRIHDIRFTCLGSLPYCRGGVGARESSEDASCFTDVHVEMALSMNRVSFSQVQSFFNVPQCM